MLVALKDRLLGCMQVGSTEPATALHATHAKDLDLSAFAD